MKIVSAVALGVLVLGLATGTAKAQDDYAKKIVGKWVIDKSSGDLPPGTKIEFTKDGKLAAMLKVDTQELKIEGSYKIEKDKITVKLKVGDQTVEETATITKLDDKVLEIKDKDDKVDSFKRDAGK
ncbi:MAG: hypothetical protein K2P78_01065 [Gemmataceae bacterium]|nr:hypothetical protein [Gemmataceae bacterium]